MGDFKLFVQTPGIGAQQKADALKAVGKGFNPLSMNFLNLLLENKRFELVKKMVDQFEERYREDKGIVLCQILSAQELTAPQKQEVQKAAKSKARAMVRPPVGSAMAPELEPLFRLSL